MAGSRAISVRATTVLTLSAHPSMACQVVDILWPLCVRRQHVAAPSTFLNTAISILWYARVRVRCGTDQELSCYLN